MNSAAPGTLELPSDTIDVVILGHSENSGYDQYLQPLLDAESPVSGVTFNVINLYIGGVEAWGWSTPGQPGYQQIEDLIQNATNPVLVLGLFSNNSTYPILSATAADLNYSRFVDDLLSIADHVHDGGQTAFAVYLTAHRYKPVNFLPCWHENCAIGEVMARASAEGRTYLKAGPELHDLHWCCYPSCYASDDAHPNAEGAELIALAWYEFLKRELTGVGPVCLGSINSTGTAATLSVSGSTSVSDNAMQLEVSGAVPTNWGIFFYAAEANTSPFGNGFLCARPPFFRVLPPQQSDASGHLALGLDLEQPPMGGGPGQLTPGSTWILQYWYRDPSAGGATFTTSSAASVLFTP
jgi:hypothetical protein